jgi:hypothetical protein
MDENPDLTSSADSVGAYTLTLRNQTLLQPGKTGNGLRFPAYNSYAETPVFTNAESLTFSLWLYYDAAYTNNVGKRIFDYGTSRFYLYYNVDHLYLSTRGSGTSSDYSWTQQGPALGSNQWVHVAVTFDRRPSASIKQGFYINGQLCNTDTRSNYPGAEDFTIGTIKIGGNGSGRNFDGVFDDLRVYDRLLTEEEIKSLAVDPDNNHAPVIEAPKQITTQVGQPLGSVATVYDDGQPRGQTLVTQWSVVSGDGGQVQFGDPGDPATTITFTKSGDYVLMLSSTDGELSNAVKIQISAASSGTLLMVQ